MKAAVAQPRLFQFEKKSTSWVCFRNTHVSPHGGIHTRVLPSIRERMFLRGAVRPLMTSKVSVGHAVPAEAFGMLLLRWCDGHGVESVVTDVSKAAQPILFRRALTVDSQ